jgi:hypothetical protein
LLPVLKWPLISSSLLLLLSIPDKCLKAACIARLLFHHRSIHLHPDEEEVYIRSEENNRMARLSSRLILDSMSTVQRKVGAHSQARYS